MNNETIESNSTPAPEAAQGKAKRKAAKKAQYIAHLAGARLLLADMLPPGLAAQAEKREAVPRRAGRVAHGGTQGLVDLTTTLEAVLPDPHDNIFSPVASHQFCARHWEPRVLGRCDAAFDGARFVQVLL